MTFELSTTATKLVSRDFVSIKDMQDFLADIQHEDKQTRNDRVAYALATAAVLPTMVDGGMSQTNLGTSFGLSTSYISKGVKVARLLADIAKGTSDDAGALERWSNLATFARFESGWSTDDLTTVCQGFGSDDGAERLDAIGRIAETFGSLEYVYTIAEGKRLHDDDPRKAQDDDDAGDDVPADDGDDDGDSPKVSGEELIARGVRKMREDGKTDTEIAAYIMTLMS